MTTTLRLSRPVAAVAIALAAASGLVGCTKGKVTVTDTTVVTTLSSKPGVTTTPIPKLTFAANPKEIDKACPYMDAMTFRTDEGDRVGRVVQLKEEPIGCRYYFEYDPNVIVGEIRMKRFATAIEANNAMVALARTHPEFVDDRTIGDGSISVRLPLQGENTWACVFVKGTLVVVAHSRQTEVAEDARNIARDLVPVVK